MRHPTPPGLIPPPGRARLWRWLTPLLAALIATLSAVHLTGCATSAPPPYITALLDDALFNHPPRPADADAAMALDGAMRNYLATTLAPSARLKGKARALTESLYGQVGQRTPGKPGDPAGLPPLRLEYEGSSTRTAAQAFAARSGNCLSLVLMTAAFAREMGLDVRFQSAQLDDAFSRDGDLVLRSGHVNLLLAPRPTVAGWHTLSSGPDPDRLQIDFLPPSELQGLRTQAIAEPTVLAMFMNNRAAEALARHNPREAYAWAREALLRDPGFWPAINTLGVVYQHGGHLAAAAQTYEILLAQQPRQVGAMWNLAQVRTAQGRPDEAARWTERRLALEPVPPFHYLQQGQAAMARGAWGQARDLFRREQRITGESHELHFWLAQAHFRMGEVAAAARELQQAASISPSPDMQARYAGKLAWLRAQGQL